MKNSEPIFDLVEVQRDNGYKYNFELRERPNTAGQIAKKNFIKDKLGELYPKQLVIKVNRLYQKPHIEVIFHNGEKAFIVEFIIPLTNEQLEK